jgi:hypothetical protein
MSKVNQSLTWESRFWFGKHRGKTLREVLDSDPDYLIWAHKTVEGFVLDEEILEAACMLWRCDLFETSAINWIDMGL